MIFQISIATYFTKILISGPLEHFQFLMHAHLLVKNCACTENKKCPNGPEMKILRIYFSYHVIYIETTGAEQIMRLAT